MQLLKEYFAVIAQAWCVLASRQTPTRNLIIDTDLFSDVDDAGALLIAATSSKARLLAVNVNQPSSYSALAVSAILAHYGQSSVPIGARRPLTNATFFDAWSFELGEFASKVAYHWSSGSLSWGQAEDAWDPVALYRKTLAEAEDGSVTIVSIGFFENLSGLLNSTADSYSKSTGLELTKAKVTELVVMGGDYPSGYEFNFWGDDPSATAHVVHTWPGAMVFSGFSMGLDVTSGGRLMEASSLHDPVKDAYRYYTYGIPRSSWDPLTVLYAIDGLGDLFQYGNQFGHNYVYPNGSNTWIFDESRTDQHWLELKVEIDIATTRVDQLLMEGAASGVKSCYTSEHLDL